LSPRPDPACADLDALGAEVRVGVGAVVAVRDEVDLGPAQNGPSLVQRHLEEEPQDRHGRIVRWSKSPSWVSSSIWRLPTIAASPESSSDRVRCMVAIEGPWDKHPQASRWQDSDPAAADSRYVRNLPGFRQSLFATDPADDGVEGRREQEAERGHSQHAGEDGRAQ
jgi:hypothetical protein